MRLTCPNCGAEYDVPEGLIPPAGKHVQCTACHTRWFMRGQTREELSEDQILRKLETRGSGPKPAAPARADPTAPIPFPAAGGARRDAVSGDGTSGGTAERDVARAPDADAMPSKAQPDDSAPFNWHSPEPARRDAPVVPAPKEGRGPSETAPEEAAEGGSARERTAGLRPDPSLKREAPVQSVRTTFSKPPAEPARERAEPRPNMPAPRRDSAPAPRLAGGATPGSDRETDRGLGRGSDTETGRDASEDDLAAPRIALREAPRTAPSRLDVADDRAGTTPPPKAKRRFLPGFILALLIAGLALEVYVWRDPLADQIPAAAPAIDGYANAVDAAREWLRDTLGGAQGDQPG